MAESVRRHRFEWRQVRVTMLIVVAVLLLAYAVYRVGRIFDVFASRYELVALVPSAVGLREGAPVTLAGQRIGQVKEISFIPVAQKTDDNNLVVRLAISEDVRDQVRRDSRAFLRTQGLLGDKFVDIEPGSSGAAILQSGDTLPAGETVDLEQFMAQAAGALEQAEVIVADLRDITHGLATGEGTMGELLNDDALYARMVGATTELQQTLTTLNRSNGTFGRLLRDPALYNNLTSAVARVDSLGAMLANSDGTLGKLLRDDSLYNVIVGSATSADSAVMAMSGFVQRMTEGQGTIQKLMTDPALYDEFLRAVIDLQTLINAIRENPERFKPNIRVDVF